MKKYYDAVIVGCGVAGCFAALHLPQEADILMITKADTEDSDSFLAQGGICVLKNEDDYDAFYEDTMHAGHYENTPESVDIMIRSSRNVINQLIAWGVDFRRDENGELCYTKEGAHSTNRILFHDDVTGKEITSKLLAQVKKLPNVTLLAHTEMCDILSCKNVCEGVLIRDEEGKLIPVYARDVIWACGGIGGIYDNSTNFPHLTGDALAIAIHRNVALKNVNYVQIHPTTLYSQKKGRRFLISESVRGEGAVLLDKNGERFTNELQPRDVVSREIHRQMEKDHTKHVWLSLKTIPLDVKERFPNIYQKCLEEGYDITKEPIPVVPAQHYFMGGVKVDSIYRADFIYKNLQIQQNVIGESFRHNVKKLLFLGSTCIYPRDAEQPMKEDVLLTSPLEYTNEPYAIAKIAGLKMCESFNLQYGTNYIAVMPTNLYGPNDNFDLERSHVLPAMIRKVHLAHCLQQGNWDAVRLDMNQRPVEGISGSNSNAEILDILAKYGISDKEVKLWGTGTPLREFLWSEEMADASVFVMEHVDFKDTYKPGDKDVRNCHINIGTGKEITIRQLAELIVDTVGYQGKLTFDSTKPDGTMRKLTDPSKLHALGWHHKIDIEEGVQRMYRWYLGND